MKPMHRSFTGTSASLLSAALLAPALLLTGCGGNVSFPDTVVPGSAQQTPLGTIQGSVYGGHAPLTSAHVYVLEPGTGGYGTQATSLLGASASSTPGYATFNNSGDPGIPSSWYYVKTDGSGQFSITGDYTCTAGLPVYLYSYGGFADFPQLSGYTTNNTFNISSVSVSGSSGSYTYTFTTATPQYSYPGEQVTFNQAYGPFSAGVTNGGGQVSSGTGYTIASVPSNTTFTITAATNSTSSVSGLQATITPTFNAGIVELAVLGVCPSSGNFTTGGTLFNGTTFSPLNFVYMNEVSTVAAAYAFAPFSANGYYQNLPLRSNYASYIGTSSTNLVGLQNAALNAGMLYSVNGSGSLSTSFQGEAHIANAATPTGNGIINQAVIDTVADILASCVDSWSAYDVTVGNSSISTQCNTLFQYATNTGIPTTDSGTGYSPGVQPNDTATAAINIALHPSGPPPSDTATSSAAWVAALYNLPTGAVPFAPNLTTQPNDFTVAILYPQSLNSPYFTYIEEAQRPAVDQLGDVWLASGSGSSGYVFQMSPLGVIGNTTAGTLYNYTSAVPYAPVLDKFGNVFFAGSTTGGPLLKLTNNNVNGNPYTYSTTPTTVTLSKYLLTAGKAPYFGDNSGNMFVLEQPNAATSTTDPIYLGYIPAGYTTQYSAGQTVFTNSYTYPPYNGAFDGNGDIWLDQTVRNSTNSGTTSYVTRVQANNNTGMSPSSGTWPVTTSSSGCSDLNDQPQGIAVVRSQNAVTPLFFGNSVEYISPSTGACTEYTNSNLGFSNGMVYPSDVAVDGRDYVYVLNFYPVPSTIYNGSVTVLNESSGSSLTGQAANLSPVYYPPSSSTLTSMLDYPINMALDPSGNIWTSNSSSVVEIIGVAAPTTTPIARAACTSTTACIGYAP